MSSSTMMMGQLGPPVWERGEIDSPVNVEKEASGMGLLGRMMDVSDGVMMRIDDGGQATHVSLRSSRLALAMTGRNISSILSV